MSFTFKFLHLFIFFFPSFTFKSKRSAAGFSTFASSVLSSLNTDDACHFELIISLLFLVHRLL
jgi:hypothetical protein